MGKAAKAKREKGMTVDGAQRVLDLIASFEATAKGDAGRTQFRNVLTVGLDEGAITRDVLKDQYGFKPEQIRALFAGASADVMPQTRTGLLNHMRANAQAAVGAPAAAVA